TRTAGEPNSGCLNPPRARSGVLRCWQKIVRLHADNRVRRGSRGSCGRIPPDMLMWERQSGNIRFIMTTNLVIPIDAVREDKRTRPDPDQYSFLCSLDLHYGEPL